MSLVIIYYSLKPVKISYANGRVSVRIFYKNNLINASSKSESRFVKLVRKKIHHSANIPSNTLASSTLYSSLYSNFTAAIAAPTSSPSLSSPSLSSPSSFLCHIGPASSVGGEQADSPVALSFMRCPLYFAEHSGTFRTRY